MSALVEVRPEADTFKTQEIKQTLPSHHESVRYIHLKTLPFSDSIATNCPTNDCPQIEELKEVKRLFKLTVSSLFNSLEYSSLFISKLSGCLSESEFREYAEKHLITPKEYDNFDDIFKDIKTIKNLLQSSNVDFSVSHYAEIFECDIFELENALRKRSSTYLSHPNFEEKVT